MSVPRQVLPGMIYLLTRRCLLRQLLLRPSPEVNQIFEFCLAMASQRFGVEIHCYCVLSNHYHAVVTDVHGNLPEFMHWVNEYVAKCVNAQLGRWESFWAPGSYSAVRLIDAVDILDKMVYVYANPVEGGLVRSARQWPGARSLPEQFARPKTLIQRPQGFFRPNGPVPDSATLELFLPKPLAALEDDPIELLERALEAREQQFRASVRRFLGPRRVLAQSPFSFPGRTEPRRGLNPRVASRDKWRRIQALQQIKQFLDAYRQAWIRFREGDPAVRFPAGTYWMRVRLGIQCCET